MNNKQIAYQTKIQQTKIAVTKHIISVGSKIIIITILSYLSLNAKMITKIELFMLESLYFNLKC